MAAANEATRSVVRPMVDPRTTEKMHKPTVVADHGSLCSRDRSRPVLAHSGNETKLL